MVVQSGLATLAGPVALGPVDRPDVRHGVMDRALDADTFAILSSFPIVVGALALAVALSPSEDAWGKEREAVAHDRQEPGIDETGLDLAGRSADTA